MFFLKGKLIGIGGISRAGKSTLSHLLSDQLSELGYSVLVISQDDYTIPTQQLTKIKDKPDWELPSSINWSRLNMHVEYSLNQYDFVILEGLFSYANTALMELFDKKLFVEISKNKFIDRKKDDLRWGVSPEPEWYIEHIWQSYLVYGRPSLSEDYKVLNGSQYFDVKHILSHILS